MKECFLISCPGLILYPLFSQHFAPLGLSPTAQPSISFLFKAHWPLLGPGWSSSGLAWGPFAFSPSGPRWKLAAVASLPGLRATASQDREQPQTSRWAIIFHVGQGIWVSFLTKRTNVWTFTGKPIQGSLYSSFLFRKLP